MKLIDRARAWRDIVGVMGCATIVWACGACDALGQTRFPTEAQCVRVGGTVIMKCDAGANGPTNCRAVTAADPLPVSGGGGSGGGGDASAANQSSQIALEQSISDRIGALTSPATGSTNARLALINGALGSPFQAGGSIGNTVFGATQSGTWDVRNITGTISLPSGAATETTVNTLFKAGQSIGNTSFAATQSGGWSVGLNAGTNAIGSITNSTFASTVANGANVAEGNTADTAYAGTGSASLVAALKGVYAQLGAVLTRQADGSQVVRAPATTPTALGGFIGASSGATLALTFTNTTRGEVVNPSTATIWASWGAGPAVNGGGSIPIAPGGSYSADRVAGTLTLLSTAANQPYTFTRF